MSALGTDCTDVLPYRNLPRRRLWKGARAYLWSSRTDLVQVGVAIAICVAIIVYFNRGFFGGFVSGLLIMFFAAVISFAYLIHGDGVRWMHGAWAEDWTREDLQAAIKRGAAWHVLDFLPLQGGDIDHVVIAPAGVIAVETKYFGRPTRAAYLSDHVRQAARSALRVDGLIRSVRQYRHPVRPLLVVWGPGAVSLDEIGEVDGVTVVRGSALPVVLKTFATGPLARDHAETLADALTTYRKGLTA